MITIRRRCCDHQLAVDGTVQRMRFIDLFICQTKPIYLQRNYFAVCAADLYDEFSLFTFNVAISTNIREWADAQVLPMYDKSNAMHQEDKMISTEDAELSIQKPVRRE